MDEFIDTLKEKIINSISNYPINEKVYITTQLGTMLLVYVVEIVKEELSKLYNNE